MRYPVTLTKDTNGTFLVRFPDVPDAVTFGDTKEEALAQGQDALLTVFDAYIRDRRDIPQPSERPGLSIELPALETAKLALYVAMRDRNINKSELARRLDWHLPQVDRVLDVHHGSQIDQLEAAFAALGKKLVVNVVDDPATSRVTYREHAAAVYGRKSGEARRVVRIKDALANSLTTVSASPTAVPRMRARASTLRRRPLQRKVAAKKR
jgi:antitoxin HicB